MIIKNWKNNSYTTIKFLWMAFLTNKMECVSMLCKSVFKLNIQSMQKQNLPHTINGIY